MRRLLVSFVAVVVACGHPAPAPVVHAPTAPAWKGPEILASVPADTPYLFGVLEAPAPAVRARLVAQSGEQIKAALKKAATGEGRAALVAAALYAELDGVEPAHWMESLGFSSESRFVLYGMSLWPVLRVEVKDANRVRELLARIVKAGAPDVRPETVGHAELYKISESYFSVVFGVVDNQLVATVMPDMMLDTLMPSLTGTTKPEKSLRDATVLPALLARHRYIPSMIAYVDTLRLLEVVSHNVGNKLTPQCHDDLARIAGVMPRLVLGYRRLDERGFVATMAIESPRDVIRGLAKLHTPMPALETTRRPMFALAAAVNIDAMFGWMRDVTGQLRSHPFRCDEFDKVNHSIDELASKLDEPLPPMVQGLRGFELVIDDASVMPPSGTGHVLMAGDHIADLVHQMLVKIPQLAALQLPPDGSPVELPLSRLGIPASFKSAHVALRPTRAALAIGNESARRASERTGARDAHVPLIEVSYDLPKIKERFGMFLKEDDFAGLSNIGSTSLALDVGDDGIDLDMVGTWAPGH
ncbi:MAG: hypothetical protein JO257_15960 [Deltaproteobacteria bacterium]|nr:hypothetical protein [Deltaproteobacteria bacterium]